MKKVNDSSGEEIVTFHFDSSGYWDFWESSGGHCGTDIVNSSSVEMWKTEEHPGIIKKIRVK